MTGIVKAYAKEGTNLSETDAKNANKEMSDLATISEENSSILQEIGDFFVNIFNAIVDFFKNLI